MAKRGKDLSADDEALWHRTMRDVSPLKGGGSKAPEPQSAPARRQARPEAVQSPALPGALVTPARLDVRTVRRITSGRQVIDLTLDLHGLTQDQAFRLLCARVVSARRAGRRTLLVITGKGMVQAEAPQGEARRGVLKRAVPEWLAGPALASHVIGFAPAGPRHGGAGALYVVLRKPKE